MKYKYILLDADGTIFDYDKAEKIALENTFSHFKSTFKKEYLNQYQEINMKLWSNFEKKLITPDKLKVERFKLLLGQINLNKDPIPFSENYLQNLGECSFFLVGALNFVIELHKKTTLILITNGLSKVQRSRISKSKIEKYFKEIIISEEIGFSKPDIKIFEHISNKLNNPPKDEILIIGDSLSSDIKGGNNFSIDTCWFNPQNIEKQAKVDITYEVKSYNEILEII